MSIPHLEGASTIAFAELHMRGRLLLAVAAALSGAPLAAGRPTPPRSIVLGSRHSSNVFGKGTDSDDLQPDQLGPPTADAQDMSISDDPRLSQDWTLGEGQNIINIVTSYDTRSGWSDHNGTDPATAYVLDPNAPASLSTHSPGAAHSPAGSISDRLPANQLGNVDSCDIKT